MGEGRSLKGALTTSEAIWELAAATSRMLAEEGTLRMKVEFVNPFVIAAREVLRQEIGCEVERGDLHLHKSAYTSHDVTAIIAVTGAIQGLVLYSLKSDSARKFVETILGQTFVEFDELAQSGIAELANVITGKASILLSEAGFSSQISPPALIIGNGTLISTLDLNRIVVPLRTELGDIEVHLALREVARPPE